MLIENEWEIRYFERAFTLLHHASDARDIYLDVSDDDEHFPFLDALMTCTELEVLPIYWLTAAPTPPKGATIP